MSLRMGLLFPLHVLLEGMVSTSSLSVGLSAVTSGMVPRIKVLEEHSLWEVQKAPH